jgi:CheY-like chemotaxis protein
MKSRTRGKRDLRRGPGLNGAKPGETRNLPAAKRAFFMLLADDSSEDRLLFKNSLHVTERLRLGAEVVDGREALDYFEGLGPFADREQYPLPDLLLLDLRMPRVDGFEVLTWLQPRAFTQLTVVLTDSMQPEDIKRALDLGADLFQVKPANERDRRAMVLALEKRLVESYVGDEKAE